MISKLPERAHWHTHTPQNATVELNEYKKKKKTESFIDVELVFRAIMSIEHDMDIG